MSHLEALRLNQNSYAEWTASYDLLTRFGLQSFLQREMSHYGHYLITLRSPPNPVINFLVVLQPGEDPRPILEILTESGIHSYLSSTPHISPETGQCGAPQSMTSNLAPNGISMGLRAGTTC